MTLWKKNAETGAATTSDEALRKPKLDTSIGYPRGLKLRVVDAAVLTDKGRRATTQGELDVEEVRDSKLTTVI
jgi:hypothetical protein